jgi:signal transduction histidine kinase
VKFPVSHGSTIEVSRTGRRSKANDSGQNAAIVPPYSEIVSNLPVGVIILHVESPQDASSCRIVDINPACAELTGTTVESLRGATLSEFPLILQALNASDVKEAILRPARAINLGELTYVGERIKHGVYSVKVFPLTGDCVGVAIENVTEERIAELELRMEIAEWRSAEEQVKASRDELRELAARLQRIREDERTRIAREIHDELGQACTALKMDVALLARKLPARKSLQVMNKIKSAMAIADGLIHSMRRIASGLRPAALDDLGLAVALEWQAQEFEKRTSIQCCIALPSEYLAIDTDRSTAIFRIFQESLTNVARHSQATRVEATLSKERTQIVLEIRDNGRGFDSKEVKTRNSFGLIGMEERAILLNGTLHIAGNQGQGTTVTLRVPVS